MRFFSLPKIISFFASIFSRKNTENHGFWLPKTLPKSFPKGCKNDVPKNMRIFMDFCWIFVACCKSRTSKFMRPRSVLLMLNQKRILAFRMHFGPKKPTENTSKTTSEPFKNRCQKRCFFQHRFFRVLASILEPLAPPSPPRCLQRQAC